MRPPPGIHWVVGAYVLGLCLALRWSPGAGTLCAAAALAGVGAVIAWRRTGPEAADDRGRVPWGVLALLPLVLFCGVTVGTWRLADLAQSRLLGAVGEQGAVEGVILTLPEACGDGLGFDLRVRSFEGRACDEKVRVSLEVGDRWSRPSPEQEAAASAACDPVGEFVEGTVVRFEDARLEPLPEAEPGAFDYGRYLERRGEHVVLAATLADCVPVGCRGGVAGLCDRLRVAAREHLRRGMRPPVREVLEAMVLGDDGGVDEQAVEDFRRSGLLHIMAVSGENVVLLCAITGLGLRLVGVPRAARTAGLIPLVCVYVIVTGAAPSIVRAGVAGVVGLLATLVSRPADGWLLLLIPGAYLLSVNPNALFDVSFQLSFAAVVGLLTISRPLTALAARVLPGALAEQAGVTTAASLATAPVSIVTFGSASVVSVAANVVAGFSLGPIMLLGMVSVLLGFVSPWLSLPLNVVAGLIIGFMLTVAAFFGRLPFAVYEWHGITPTTMLIAALGAELTVVALLARRRGVGLRAFATGRRRRRVVAVVTVAVIAVSWGAAPAQPAPPPTTTLTILSVGEGAAALLQSPDGPTVLIDAGPGPLAETLRQHGVERIDLLVLSHGHADHTAGLDDIYGKVPIAGAVIPDDEGTSQSMAAVRGELAAEEIPTTVQRTPAQLACGEARVTILPTTSDEGGNQGENDRALVCVVTLAGQRVLLPGDAEAKALEPLDLCDCAIVEWPHHGSEGGLTEEQLDELQPLLAVISVGENRFGHPTPEALDLLASEGIPCLRTDTDGEVRLWVDDARLVMTMGK